MNVENTEHICSKCGKEFQIQDEANSNYNNYCDNCLKIVIQEQMESLPHDEEYYD